MHFVVAKCGGNAEAWDGLSGGRVDEVHEKLVDASQVALEPHRVQDALPAHAPDVRAPDLRQLVVVHAALAQVVVEPLALAALDLHDRVGGRRREVLEERAALPVKILQNSQRQ